MIAFVRDVGQRFHERESACIQGARIDLKRAKRQHAKLIDALKNLGADVEFFPPLPDEQDAVFVGSTAACLPEVTVLARAPALRQPEVDTASAVLGRHRLVVRLADPASLVGADAVRIGRTVYVGIGKHTNADAVQLLGEAIEPFGYETRTIELGGCEHLKSACTFIPPDIVLLNPALIDAKAFRGFRVIEVEGDEPFAANTLSLGGKTLVSAACPKTERRLAAAGVVTCAAELDEFHKVGAGISDLVLLLEPRAVQPAPVSSVRVVESGPAPDADGVFAPAVVHEGVVYVSGQLPIDPKTGKPIGGGIEEQTKQAVANLASVLVASGSSTSRLLRVTFFVSDAKYHEPVARVCARILGGHRPAGTIVAAKSLLPGCAVAIDAIAAVVDEPSATLR